MTTITAKFALATLVLVVAVSALTFSGRRTEKAAESVTARELCQAYQANEASADGRYRSNVVRVSGRVQNTGSLQADSAYVVLACQGYATVQCGLQNAGDAAQFLKGANATLICTGDGKKMGTVALRDCRPEI